jgi:competence protein ComEA
MSDRPGPPPGTGLLLGLLAAFAATTAWCGARRAAPGGAPARGPAWRVDINAAGAAELELLPGIGPQLAQRIVAEREKNGPFASLDDLAARVSQLGSATPQRFGTRACVGAPADPGRPGPAR